MKIITKYATTLFLVFFLISSNIFCQSAAQIVDDVDNYYKQFNNEKALELLKKAEKTDASNFEIIWRLSRTYIDIGEKMPSSTSEQEAAQIATYQKALEYAEKAVTLQPNNSISYLRRAIANGRIALFKGVFSVAGVVNSVKADAEKAIQLNTGGNFYQAVAHYVLGRTHAKTSEKWKPARAVLGLGWADNEIAIKEYKKAIELYPTYIMFYVDYANSLIREDEFAVARDMLKKALTLSQQHQDDEKKLADARKTLNDIKDE